MFFTGCGEDEVTKPVSQHTVVQETVQPQYTQQQPQEVHHYNHNADSGVGDVLMGAAVGMMVGNALSNNDNGYNEPRGSTTVVNKTVVNKTYTPSSINTPTSLNHTTTKVTPEKPIKAQYRTETVKKPEPVKAQYREKTKTQSYKPTPKQASYRPKPKKTSSWGSSFKKSSYRSSSFKKR